MTDTYAHLGVQQLWKSLHDPKMVSNSTQNALELAKTMSVDERHVNAPRCSEVVEITMGPPKLRNSPRNEPESAQTAIVDDLHLSAHWGSSTMEITLGPQNGE